jgi:hypothetical protein
MLGAFALGLVIASFGACFAGRRGYASHGLIAGWALGAATGGAISWWSLQWIYDPSYEVGWKTVLALVFASIATLATIGRDRSAHGMTSRWYLGSLTGFVVAWWALSEISASQPVG